MTIGQRNRAIRGLIFSKNVWDEAVNFAEDEDLDEPAVGSVTRYVLGVLIKFHIGLSQDPFSNGVWVFFTEFLVRIFVDEVNHLLTKFDMAILYAHLPLEAL